MRDSLASLTATVEGVQSRLANLEVRALGRAASFASSRRRKGPAFLPSEHDELPVNVAFMVRPQMADLADFADSVRAHRSDHGARLHRALRHPR